MTIAIKIEGLSKKYIIKHERQEQYSTLRESLSHSARSFVRRIRHPLQPNTEEIELEEFWALKDINIEINQGDKVGIIGRNGAGKSTLLKILSRITEPTAGRIHIKGRIVSLLEVGTGFHSELTGRENIYLNGAILGMHRKEINSKFDEIIDFADIEKFLDTPVKRYSSGMYVRLAFAVAAHLEPEILIVDEVLAVGDAQFQKKCLGKMEQVGSEGRTVILVSHNLPAIQRLCNKAILLESGRLKSQGEVPNILSQYMQADSLDEKTTKVEVKSGEAKFVSWRLRNASTDMAHSCYSRDECIIEFRLVAKRVVSNAIVGFAITNVEGILVFATSSLDSSGKYLELQEGVHNITFKIRLPIKADAYQLDVSLNDGSAIQVDRWMANPMLVVLPKLATSLPNKWQGLVNEEAKFEIAWEGN